MLYEVITSDEIGPDSQNLLQVLMGESQMGRDELVLEANTRTAFRKA